MTLNHCLPCTDRRKALAKKHQPIIAKADREVVSVKYSWQSVNRHTKPRKIAARVPLNQINARDTAQTRPNQQIHPQNIA
ncbi:MAG: hypothetical protein ACRCWS_06165, partial [Propionibacteriaceae bacterium]